MIKCNKGEVSISGTFDVCLAEIMTVLNRLIILAKETEEPLDEIKELTISIVEDIFDRTEKEETDDERSSVCS